MTRFTQFVATAAILAGAIAPSASFAQDADMSAQSDVQARGVITDIIDGLVGNRYRATDREAVRNCGWAAVDKAEREYRRYWTGGRPPFAYPGYRGHVRVVAITDVRRRITGVRVTGVLDTARNGWRGGRRGDVNFRCDTNRNGRVQTVRLDPIFRIQ